MENAKQAAVTSTVPTVLTKHMDSDEEPIASFFSVPKISNAQSIYHPIFQPSIDTSLIFSPVNVSTKVFCPTCNKGFFVTEIKEHADVCLTRKTQRNIIDITNDSDAEDSTSYIDFNGNDTDKSNTTDTKSHFLSKIKSVLLTEMLNLTLSITFHLWTSATTSPKSGTNSNLI